MASSYTTNYNLDKYVASDKPNLRDQYNTAMDKIDAQLFSVNGAAASALNVANGVNEKLGNGFSAASTVAMQLGAEVTARENGDTALQNQLGSGFSAESTVTAQLGAEVTARENADTALQNAETALQNQLGSGFSSENTVAENVTSMKADIDELKRSASDYHGKTFLCVTDSWGSESSNNVTRCWMRQVVEDCFDGTYIDLHAGSTGYIYAGSYGTFLTRVTNYVSQHQDTVGDIDFVMVCGSSNDYSNAAPAIATAVTTFVNYCLANFPNAKVILVPQFGNQDIVKESNNHDTGNTNPWINASAGAQIAYLDNFTLNPRVIIVKYTTYLLMGYGNYMNADNVHPNQNGQNWLAKNVYSFLTNGSVLPSHFSFVPKAIKSNAGWVGGNAYVSDNIFNQYATGHIDIVDGVAQVTFVAKLTATVESGKELYVSLGNLVPLGSRAYGLPISGGSWFNSSRESYYGALSGRGFNLGNYPYGAVNDNSEILCAFVWYGESNPQSGDAITQTMNLYLELV